MTIFSEVQNKRPSRNTFDLSHEKKMSLQPGELIPILAMETVPGDKINISTSQMLRFAPLISPLMHQVTVYTHAFFVPNRIVWDGWEDFITGGEDGLDTTVFPTLTWGINGAVGTMGDYLGLPTNQGVASEAVSAIPFAAYNKIFNEFYRDQNLITKIDDVLSDGNNPIGPLETIQIRAWQHDYFTSALPWTQKGAEATIPLGTSAPIQLSGTFSPWITLQASDLSTEPSIASMTSDGSAVLEGDGVPLILNPVDTLEADLSTATAATINDLRNAYRLQEWLELNARAGSRYTESILSHFGVKSSDARLQRPEFLGGGASQVVISEVLQTGETAGTPQGTMAGHAIAVGASGNFTYSCEEHGYIMIIMSVIPKTAYQQGIPKHFLKTDKFDFFWPSFAHLGEQPILNKELYASTDGNNDLTFGYTPRYAEYKYLSSTVHGKFKTDLDFWHWGRIFATRPALNQTFIQCVPDTRIFAVETGELLYAHIYHTIKASRLMPYFGTPSGG